jgi:Arc/MetJ-type ribon-helix-helix transcriptional regulator
MTKILKWSVPVTEYLNTRLEKYIELDSFKTKSEFIRTAVRDRLIKEYKRFMKNKNV